ncbi:hypothetical protein ATANTOWER_012288 [Ataeniobius toweri]|uniref:Uncharacterized protein n=1 Tax=Ataeniobius toweri TaxID=208326 RepID=A0ABU7A1L4_9TELE|nr:hypothetical protein [Ataeniobius toweri]
MLPASSMSAHTPLPRRLDLSVGGDDGENLGSRRGGGFQRNLRERENRGSPRTTPPDMHLDPYLNSKGSHRVKGDVCRTRPRKAKFLRPPSILFMFFTR